MVVNAPTSNIHTAAEHAVTLLLSAARQIPAADATLRQHQWKRSSFNGVEIFGKTVGVVGLGRIGQLFAKRLAAFETNIHAYDPSVSQIERESCGEGGGTYVSISVAAAPLHNKQNKKS